MEEELKRLKPHQEGLLLPIIHKYRRRCRREKTKDSLPDDLMATLVIKHDEQDLSDENLMAVAIVSLILPNAASPFHSPTAPI